MSPETWIGADATMRQRSVEVSQRFDSPADRARWLKSGKPVAVPISIAQADGQVAAPGWPVRSEGRDDQVAPRSGDRSSAWT